MFIQMGIVTFFTIQLKSHSKIKQKGKMIYIWKSSNDLQTDSCCYIPRLNGRINVLISNVKLVGERLNQ